MDLLGSRPSHSIWNWDRCLDDVRGLNGRLGFPRDKAGCLAFLGLEVLPQERLVRDALDHHVASDDSVILSLLHHYSKAHHHRLTGTLVPFRKFSGGSPYEPTFRRRVLDKISLTFGDRPEMLGPAAEVLGGVETQLETYSCRVPALPLVPLTVLLWPQDEEFSASSNLLFDSSADSFLPTEMLVLLAELTSARLRKAAEHLG
ncbi:MAG: DUF3786 domain-containing protein [bacterium]